MSLSSFTSVRTREHPQHDFDAVRVEGQRVPLRGKQMRATWNLLKHPLVRMCLEERFKKLLLGRGLLAIRGGHVLNPIEALRHLIRDHYEPVARDAFYCIMAFGVVPLCFRNQKTALFDRTPIPYVPKFGTYAITTYHEDGVQKFELHRNVPQPTQGDTLPIGAPDKMSVVFSGFGFDPELDGTLSSNLMSLVPHLIFQAELQSQLLTAGRINAAPPVALEQHVTDSSSRDENLRTGFFAGQVSSAEDKAMLEFENNNLEQALMDQQMRMQAEHYGFDPHEYFQVRELAIHGNPEQALPATGVNWRGHQMPWSTVYPVPRNRRVVQLQLPHARNDFVPITEQIQNVVCGVLNVPKAALFSNTNVKAGAEQASESIMWTVAKDAQMLSSIITRIYEMTLRPLILKQSFAQQLRQMREKRRRYPDTPVADLVTEDDLFTAKREAELTFEFDVPPSTTPERLVQLYESGIINRDVFADEMLRVNHLSRDKRAEDVTPATSESDTEPMRRPRKRTHMQTPKEFAKEQQGEEVGHLKRQKDVFK